MGGPGPTVNIPLLSDGVLLEALARCGSVTGQVSGKRPRKPVPAATVVVGKQRAVTDNDGHFTMDRLDMGAAPVAVAAAGFAPHQGTLKVKRGENTLKVVLESGAVSGILRENAEVCEPITDAKVMIAGKAAAAMRGAHFNAVEAPVGTQTIVVTAPGHATYSQEVVVAPGANRVEIALDLTPVETYLRYYAAYRFGRWREVHRFVHPDVKKHEAYKAFVKGVKRGRAVYGFELLGSRHLEEWRSTWMQKTYHDVVAIDRRVRYEDIEDTYSEQGTRHWQQIDGRWFIIYDDATERGTACSRGGATLLR